MRAVECVLLDIEGTVCPISFVKSVLFPYAIKALPKVLATKWDDEDFRPYRDAFPEEHRGTPEALQAHVEDLTKRDVKIAYLKNLQGYLWKDGYSSGAYSTDLFPDVVPELRRWMEMGLSLAIYSSGSVFAQKLLFGHVQERVGSFGDGEKMLSADSRAPSDEPVGDSRSEPSCHEVAGNHARNDGAQSGAEVGGREPGGTQDLTNLFDSWFDTTNAGLKTEASSYTKIAEALKRPPKEILFLSDNVKEVDAAIEAKMVAILVDRPGNAPLTESDRHRLPMVESLNEIDALN